MSDIKQVDGKVKAIETVYKGYRFRSRLEARWAVFFDIMGIKWLYEDEGYELGDGTRYLPDFYLPTFHGGMYVEVKPDTGDFKKSIQFAQEANVRMWIANGLPRYVPPYQVFYGNDCFGWDTGVPNWSNAMGENRMFYQCEWIDESFFYPDDLIVKACEAAKRARFEHGECGI